MFAVLDVFIQDSINLIHRDFICKGKPYEVKYGRVADETPMRLRQQVIAKITISFVIIFFSPPGDADFFASPFAFDHFDKNRLDFSRFFPHSGVA